MDLLDLLHRIDQVLIAVALASVRLLVVFTVLPVLGQTVVPGTIRGGMILGLSITIIPLVIGQFPPGDPSFAMLGGLALKEALLGFLLGYAFAIVFWVAGAVGYLIDTQRGAALADAMNPGFEDPSSPMGVFFSQVLTTFLFASGGFLALLSVVYQSYVIWPLFTFVPAIDSAAGIRFFLNQFDLLMYLTLLLGAPALLLMFFAEFGLGLVGRFVPQLNIFFVALSVKSLIAFFVLSLSLGGLFDLLREQLLAQPALLQGLSGLLQD